MHAQEPYHRLAPEAMQKDREVETPSSPGLVYRTHVPGLLGSLDSF